VSYKLRESLSGYLEPASTSFERYQRLMNRIAILHHMDGMRECSLMDAIARWKQAGAFVSGNISVVLHCVV